MHFVTCMCYHTCDFTVGCQTTFCINGGKDIGLETNSPTVQQMVHCYADNKLLSICGYNTKNH